MLYDNSDDSIGYEIYDSAEDETVTMHFQKNLQGDITGVYNFECGQILSYTYDAWGNMTVEYINDSVGAVLATVKALLYTPITYRGYMYDFFTGLYYLQSRYYNPAYGRFLNVDDTDIIEVTQGTSLGANLFAYCNNNPVMNVDYSGLLGGEIIAKIILVMIGIFLAGLLLSWLDIIPDFMLEWKLTKLLKDSPKLGRLVEYWSEIDDTSGYVSKYWYIYSLFMAHAKNLVDYAKDPNLSYSYPCFNEIVGSDVSYTETLKLAYDNLTQCNYYEIGTSWEDLGPNGQFELIHYMYVYDPYTYRRLVEFSLHELLEFGNEELESFFNDLLEIVERSV